MYIKWPELLLLFAMAYLRLLLLPFSLLYGLAVWVRNRCYDVGLFKSRRFEKPVIVIGNLAVGGTGKSPMTEHLIRLLDGKYKVATLSRGYGRRTRGFLEVPVGGQARWYGDEPLQFKRKFPHIAVAVGEDRVHGVEQLIKLGHDVIVLDDAFQHRALRAGFSILLFDYQSLGKPKWLLPAGNYRDCFHERKRADLIVVTKTPVSAERAEKAAIRSRLEIDGNVPVLFSSIGYGSLTSVLPGVGPAPALEAIRSVLLVTGIANPQPLYSHLKSSVPNVVHLRYPDHYQFTVADIRKAVAKFKAMDHREKLIVTTEKDAERLSNPEIAQLLVGLPVYAVPIRVVFDDKDARIFEDSILGYCSGMSGESGGEQQ
jgi:tetraacyldisaccharide 4''-kinase